MSVEKVSEGYDATLLILILFYVESLLLACL